MTLVFLCEQMYAMIHVTHTVIACIIDIGIIYNISLDPFANILAKKHMDCPPQATNLPHLPLIKTFSALPPPPIWWTPLRTPGDIGHTPRALVCTVHNSLGGGMIGGDFVIFT